MLLTYPAIVRGDTIEWLNETPPQLTNQQALSVHVTILDETPPTDATQGQRMADILEQISRLPTSSFPADAMQWEREIRQDRPLPGREDEC